MSDEDVSEMESLRRSKQYSTHVESFGNRAAARRQKQELEDAEEAARDRALEIKQASQPSSTFVADMDEEEESGPALPQRNNDQDDFPKPLPRAPKTNSKPSSSSISIGKIGSKVPTSIPPLVAARPAPEGKSATEIDDDGKDEEESMREMFPLTFGKQNGANRTLQEIHAARKRKSASSSSSSSASGPKMSFSVNFPTAAQSSSSKSDHKTQQEDIDDMDNYGPPRPPHSSSSSSSAKREEEKHEDNGEAAEEARGGDDDVDNQDDLSEDSEDDDFEQNPFELPITHEATLTGHTKSVTALALDPSGSRVLTGGNDYNILFYDFAGMNSRLQNFRSIEPDIGHKVVHVEYSISGDCFLALTGSAVVKLFTRDGSQILETLRGDGYLFDPTQTKGHTTGCTNGHFHPEEKNTFMSSGLDGTIRIWDVKFAARKNKSVLRLQTAQKRAAMTCCAYSNKGEFIAGGGSDGSIQLFSTKSSMKRPEKIIKAHAEHSEITCIKFSLDGHTMVSRSTDATVKLWDIRNPSQAVHALGDLDCFISGTDVTFSPNEQIIATCTSSKKDDAGRLVFIDRRDFKVVQSITVADRGTARLVWNKNINQILVGSTDGSTHVFYDPKLSKNGALLCAARQPRKADITDLQNFVNPLTPQTMRGAGLGKLTKRQKLREAEKHVPQRPLATNKGAAGRVGTSYKQFLVRELVVQKNRFREQDPREALLAVDKEARENPVFFGNAYAETAPAAQYDLSYLETLQAAEKDKDIKRALEKEDEMHNVRRA